MDNDNPIYLVALYVIVIFCIIVAVVGINIITTNSNDYQNVQYDALRNVAITSGPNDTITIVIPQKMPSDTYFIYTSTMGSGQVHDNAYQIDKGQYFSIPANGIDFIYITWMTLDEIKYYGGMHCMTYFSENKISFKPDGRRFVTSVGM